MSSSDQLITKEMAMEKTPHWRLKNGHCVSCGVKCFDIVLIPPETTDSSKPTFMASSGRYSLHDKINEMSLNKSTPEVQKIPLTSYEEGVIDGYCSNCNIYRETSMDQEMIDDNKVPPSTMNPSTTITTASTPDGILNVKRADGDSNFVVVGPCGMRSQSSSFVPPGRVAQAAPSGKEIAENPSYAHMPSLILSTRNTDSMNVEGALVDASAPVVEHFHHSSSVETVFPDGIFSGTLSAEGNPEGLGSMQFHDGGVYKGNWASGRMHGTGTFDYADGGQYCGEWKKGNIHGMGKFSFANGCVYHGKWRNGKMDGKGTYIFSNNETYVGEWKRNQPEGHGCFTYKSGNKYEGSWSKGKRDGNGTFYYKNGDIYVGEWKADRKDGIGLYRWSQSNSKLGLFLDIKTYVDDEAQEGIRWNANKSRAWRLVGGIEAAEVSLAEAFTFKENASTISPYLFMSLMQDFQEAM